MVDCVVCCLLSVACCPVGEHGTSYTVLTNSIRVGLLLISIVFFSSLAFVLFDPASAVVDATCLLSFKAPTYLSINHRMLGEIPEMPRLRST